MNISFIFNQVWLIAALHEPSYLCHLYFVGSSIPNTSSSLSHQYYSLVLPQLDYCNVIWGRTTQSNLQKLQKLQNRYARMILNAEFLTPHKQMLQTLHWQSVTQRIQYNTGLMMYKIMNDLAPAYLQSLVEKRDVQIVTRYAIACPLLIQKPRTDYYKKSFHYQGSLLWNNLPDCVRSSHSLVQYKKHIKSLIDYDPWHDVTTLFRIL